MGRRTRCLILTNNGSGVTVVRFEDVPGHTEWVRVCFESHDPIEISIKSWAESGLHIGQVLAWESINELKMEGQRALFYNKALSYMSYKSRTKYELQQYLRRKECPAEIAERVVQELEASRYLDDGAYAKQFIQANGKAQSRREIVWKLKKRGVAPAAVSAAFSEDETAHDEYRAAQSLAQKQWARRHADPEHVRRSKVGAFLQRKGFSMTIIYKVLDDLGSTSNEEFDLP